MKNVFWSKTIQMAGLFGLVFIIASWQPKPKKAGWQSYHKQAAGQDTIIPKSAYSDQINLQLNLDSVMQQINIALAKIDYQKVNADVQKAMAEIDYDKINKEIKAAMKNIDWSQMKTDISKSLDSAKMAISNIRWDAMKAEMSKAQKQMAEQKMNMDSVKIQVQKSLQEAQKSLEEAKIEFHNYKALQTALQNDGLIEANKPYRIELKEGILYINGIKQTQTVTDKYSRYYSGKKNFTISDDGGTDL